MDGLENELRGQLRVIRIDVQSPAGETLAPIYGFQFTPTFVFLDGDGQELWREIGALDGQRVRESLR